MAKPDDLLKGIVNYHLGLGLLAGLMGALAVVLSITRGDPIGIAPEIAGIMAVLFALALGLHLRLDWVRKLEIVLLPLSALGLTAAVVADLGDPDRSHKPLFVVGLYWVKVVYAVKIYLSPRVRAAFASGDRPPLLQLAAELAKAALGIATVGLLGALAVGLAYARWSILPPEAKDDPLQLLGTGVGALVGALLIVVAGMLLFHRRTAKRQAPEQVPEATRERIFALRDADEGLRGIVRALEAEGLAPPGGGRWTPSRVKEVLLLRPARAAVEPEREP
jgi:hypothetical protein